jgi:hypothetical protein
MNQSPEPEPAASPAAPATPFVFNVLMIMAFLPVFALSFYAVGGMPAFSQVNECAFVAEKAHSPACDAAFGSLFAALIKSFGLTFGLIVGMFALRALSSTLLRPLRG